MQLKVKATGKTYSAADQQVAYDSLGATRVVGYVTPDGVFGPNEVTLMDEPEIPEVPEAPPEATPKARSRKKD